MSRKKAAVEAIKAKKAQERAEEQAKAQAAKGMTTSKASKSSNASKPKLPPPALTEAPTSTGFVAAKRLEDATPEELERLRLTPDGRMFRREMSSSNSRALKTESRAESSTESAEKAGTAATPAAAPLDPADWTARPHTSFKTRLYDQYARNSAARATLLDRFAEMERERKEREEREAKEKDDDAARAASTETEPDEYDEHQSPQPSDTEDAMTKTNRTASETVEADEDDEPLEQHDPRLEEKDGEVDLDDFDYNPEGLARMISDGYSDEDDEEDDDASEDEEEDEDEEDEEEDVVRASVDASAAASATPASPASPAVSALSESKEEAKPAAKTPAKTAGKTESAEASVSSGNSGKNPAKVDAEAQKKPAEKAPAKTPAKTPKTQAAAPKKTPAKAQAPKTAAKNTPKNGTKNGTKTAAKPQVTAQGKKATQQPKTQAKQQPQQSKPAASAPKTTAPAAPKASTPEAKAPAIDPATPVVMKTEVPANVVEPVVAPVLEPVTEEAVPAYVAAPEAPAAAEAPEPDTSPKPEKPAKKVRDKTGRRAHGYADALRHAADVKAASEARVEVSIGRTLDEITGVSEEDGDETDAEIETMTPALRFSTANATLEADEPAPMLASQGTKGSKASRDGTLPEVERIDGRRATLPRNRTGKVLPRITPLYADDPAPVDVGRAYLYAVDERARALMDEDADRLMEEGFRDRYVVRTDRDGPSPVENCLRLEAETPAILDAEAAARRARQEKEEAARVAQVAQGAQREAADRDADGTIEGDAREPRKTVRFGRFPFALLPGKRARDAETKNAKSATIETSESAETREVPEAPEVCEPVDVEEARTTSARDAVAEATEGKKAAGTVPAAKPRGASVERSVDEAPAARNGMRSEASNPSAASTASKSSKGSKGSSSEATSKAGLSRPSKTTVVLGLTALVASGLAIALAFTHPAVEAGVKKTTEVLKSCVPAALTGASATDALHPAILVVDRGVVEERAALARLAATRPGAQASLDSQEPNAFASIDREAIDRAIEATAAEHHAIVLDRRLVLAAAPEFALEYALSSDVTSKTSEPSATSATSGNSATSASTGLTGLDATPEVLRRLGLDNTDPAALERAVMEHWFPKAKEARGTENAMKAGTSSKSAESAESAGVAAPGASAAPAAPAKTLRDLAALLLPEGTEHGASDAAAGFLPVK